MWEIISSFPLEPPDFPAPSFPSNGFFFIPQRGQAEAEIPSQVAARSS